jgi:hypothetical protein
MIFLDFFLLSSQFWMKISIFFFNFEKTQNPTQTGAAKTQTQPKPKIFRKTQP